MTRPPWLRLVALFAAAALLLPGSAFARSQFYCRAMDRVMHSCCCERTKATAGTQAGPELRGTGCCEKLTSPDRSGALGPRDATPDVGAPALSTLLPPALYRVPVARSVATPPRQARAPPSVGPPLFIAHCSLLH